MVTQLIQSKFRDKRLKYIFPWLVCSIGALFYGYEYFLRIVPSVMTHDLMKIFQIDATHLGNLAAFYYYAYDPMQLPVGLLMDRYGPRRLLTIACLACAIGSYIFTVPIFAIAATGRFLVGFGSAFAFVGVLKLATIWLPADRFALVSGLATSLGMAGAIGGDLALTSMVQWLGWQQTVIVASVLGVILALIIWFVIRDWAQRPRKIERCDYSISTARLCDGLIEIVLTPQIWINGIIGCLLFLPLTAFAELWGIPYLEAAANLTSLQAAFANAMVFLGFGLGGVWMGWFSDHIKRRRLPITIGAILAGVTMSIILYMHISNLILINVLLFLLGVFSSCQVIVFAIGRESSPLHSAGTALAITNLLIMLGGVIFQPIIGYLLDKHAATAMSGRIFSSSDFQYALSILPVAFLVTTLLSLFLRETGAHTR